MNKLTIILLVFLIEGQNLNAKTKRIERGIRGKEQNGTITEINKGTQTNNGTITEINWYYSLPLAKKKQERTNLPLMIDFYAPWCIWCKILDMTTFKDKDVIEKLKDFIPVKIDCTKDKTIAHQYKILGLPTIVFEGTQGTRYNVIGFKNPDDFIKEIERARKTINP